MAEGGDLEMEPVDPKDTKEDDDDPQREREDWRRDWDTRHYVNPLYEPYDYGEKDDTPLIHPVEKRFADKEKAEDFLRSIFIDPKVEQLLCGVDDYDRVWVSLTTKRAAKYVHQPSGRFLSASGKEMPRTIKELLGRSYDEALGFNDDVVSHNEDRISRLKQTLGKFAEAKEKMKDLMKRNKDTNKTIVEEERVVDDLRTQLEKSTSPSEKERLEEEVEKTKSERAKNRSTMEENDAEIARLRQQTESGENQEEIQQQIESLEAENERLGEQNEELFSRMSLREKIKYIFKKYGVTVLGVLAAVGTVIGVIVSNLRTGLTNLAKGVGDGFKDIGKKLGQILPGMIGAIVSFLFKAAGEAVGFLAKHTWLLIVLGVTFAIEKFKKK